MADSSPRPIDIRAEQALRDGATSPSGTVSFCEAYVVKKSHSLLIRLDLERIRELVEVGDQLRFEIGWRDGGEESGAVETVPGRRVHACHIVDVTQINDDGTIAGTSRFEPL